VFSQVILNPEEFLEQGLMRLNLETECLPKRLLGTMDIKSKEHMG